MRRWARVESGWCTAATPWVWPRPGLVRLLPTAATVVGWHLCDHTGPVFEDDVVDVAATLDAVQPVANGQASWPSR